MCLKDRKYWHGEIFSVTCNDIVIIYYLVIPLGLVKYGQNKLEGYKSK